MKAMILCAGYGTRLGRLTREIPKPMLPLADGPLLLYLIRHLRHHGFDQLMINLHYRPDIIQDHFGDGSRFGVSIQYSHEPQLLGTAGALKQVGPFFRNEDAFLVQYGDVLTDHNFSALLRFHREQNATATLLVHPRPRSNSIVVLDTNHRVTRFLERPTESERQGVHSTWVNSGVCVCSPAVLNAIPPGQPSDLPKDVFPRLVHAGGVLAQPLAGRRFAIDSEARLEEAQRALEEGWSLQGTKCHFRSHPGG